MSPNPLRKLLTSLVQGQYGAVMRSLALVLVLAVPASAQQAPPCTKDVTGILFDFGTADAPRLFKCDGRTWAAWVPPPALCHNDAFVPTPLPASAPAPSPAPGAPSSDAPPPMPPLETLPPLPQGPSATNNPAGNAECRRQCTVAFNTCVKNKCGTSLAASCRQSCDRSQTKCVSGCP